MDSEEFSLFAYQRRAMKKNENNGKQVAGRPAVQPPTTRPDPPSHLEHTSDGPTEKEKARRKQDEDGDNDEDNDSSPARKEDSTIAEKIVTASGVMSDKDKDDTNPTSAESPSHFHEGKLCWAYSHLALFVKRKEGPPAWLLQLVMRDVDQSDAPFKRKDDFPSEEINPALTAAVDQQQYNLLTPQLTPSLIHPLLPLFPDNSTMITIRSLLITRSLLPMLLLALARIMKSCYMIHNFRGSSSLTLVDLRARGI